MYVKQPPSNGSLYAPWGADAIAVGLAGSATRINYLDPVTSWTSVGASADITFDAWKNIAFEVTSFDNGSPGAYNVYYDHVKVGSNIPYYGTDGSTFEFNGLANTDQYYVDNLVVATGTFPTPEPASAVLLVTALVGLLAYAWRKRR